MTTSSPDIRQHVARRVRITRMYFGLTLEQAADSLRMPVWLLDYKENGLLPFSYQEFQDLERLYTTSWRIFFQDFCDMDSQAGEDTVLAEDVGASDELAVIVRYLAPGSLELSNENTDPKEAEFDFPFAAYTASAAHAGAGRWA